MQLRENKIIITEELYRQELIVHFLGRHYNE